MKALLVGLVVALAPLAAKAQTQPNWTYSYVPTPAQWNYQWASKQDYLGAPPLLVTGGTMTGPLVTSASTTGVAGLNVPPGTAPTSPNNGDFWSTSSGFYGQVNGVTVGPFVGAGSGTFAATAPLAVSFPSSVVTYALNFNTSLVNTGGNLGINLAHSNVFTATQSISLNTASLQAGQTGTIFQVGGADGTSPRIEIDGYGTGNTTGVPRFTCVRSDGTNASPTTLQSGDEICSLNSFGYNGSAFAGPQAGVRMYAAANWTTTSNGTYVRISTTATSDASHVITDRLGIEQDGGIVTMNAGALPTGGSKGNGTLNLFGSLYNNGTAPTGSGGGYVLATGPTVSALTVTGSFTATGLVTNADLVNTTITVNGTVCTLGSSCAPTATAASITVGTTGVASGTSNGLLYNNGAILGNLATANNGVLITSGAGVPSIATTLPSGLTAPALVVTSSFTATGLVTNADLVSPSITVNGSTCTLGSSCTPSAPVTVGSTVVNSGSNGFFLYNNAGTLGNLGTTGSAGLVVLSNSPTIASLTVNTAFTATGLVTAADLFGTNGSGNVVLTTGASLVTPAIGVATGTSLALNGCTLGANAFCATGTAAISSTLTSAAHAITSASANALVAGLNGATNPAFNVDASVGSQAAGLNVVGAVTGGTVAIAAIDSGANTNLTINAKGTGTIGIGSISTGRVTVTPAMTITGALTLSGGLNTPLVGTYGGTGVNNGSFTITVGGNFSTSAALAVTAGTTGQLAYWSSGTAIGGQNITAALTAGTNISITGTTNATIGITGQVGLSNGGTGTALVASNGGIVYSDASQLQLLAGTSTAGLCLLSQSSTAPVWGSCSGASAVSAVSNSDGTLTISPTTGSVVASLNLANANTWTNTQTFTTSNSGTSNYFPLTTNMTRTTTVGTGGIFGSLVLNHTDNGTTAALSNQGLRLTMTLNSTTPSSAFDAAIVTGITANQNVTTAYGIQIGAPSVASGKTITSWVGLTISAPSGSGTVTTPQAINIASGAGPIIQNDTTTSSSATTGALIVYGGVGIGGALNVTGTVKIGGNTMTFPGSAATLAALNLTGQNITGGATVTSLSLSTGSFTLNCGNGPLQYITNNGAFSITNQAGDSSCIVMVTNGASAGAITFFGFAVGSNTGDPLTTTNTSRFMIWFARINGVSTYSIKALQ